MKHIYVALALNVATGRDQLVGFLRNVQFESDWDIKIVPRGETSPRKLAAQCGFRSAKYLLSRFRKRNGQTIRAAVLRRV